ncbi:MAG: nitrate/nitrite transporter [Myxococcota bacterium]
MPPRIFYGWWVALASTVTLAFTLPGQTVLVSVFTPHLQSDLRLTATELSLIYMMATLTASLPMTFVGRLADRFGPRLVTIAATLGLAISCVWMGNVRSGWGALLGLAGLRMFGQGAMGLLSGHAVALWFESELRRVEALRSAVMGLATSAFPPFTFWLIASWGWRWAYPSLGALAVMAVLPLVIGVQRDTPESMGLRVDGRRHDPTQAASAKSAWTGLTLAQALRTRTYWVLLSVAVLHASLGTGVLFHNQALAEAGQLPLSVSALGLSAFGGSSLAATGLLFLLGARLPYRPGLVAIPVALSLSCAGIGMARSAALFVGSMMLLGIGMALIQASLTPCIAVAFGRRHHGTIRGSVMTWVVAGTALGPVLLGVSVDVWGSFQPVLFAAAVPAFLLCLALLRIRLDEPSSSVA